MMGEGRFHTKSEALSRWTTLLDTSETQLGSMLEVELRVEKHRPVVLCEKATHFD